MRKRRRRKEQDAEAQSSKELIVTKQFNFFWGFDFPEWMTDSVIFQRIIRYWLYINYAKYILILSLFYKIIECKHITLAWWWFLIISNIVYIAVKQTAMENIQIFRTRSTSMCQQSTKHCSNSEQLQVFSSSKGDAELKRFQAELLLAETTTTSASSRWQV